MSKETTQDGQWLFYNPELLPNISPAFFDSAFWQEQNKITGSSVGRGTTWFFCYQETEFVLRHYLRGGLVAKVNREHYLFTGKKNTRSWQEFNLLQQLQEQALPVPTAAAGRVLRSGLCYQADLIITRIPQSQDLVHLLRDKSLSEQQWREIGRVLALFHKANVEHADLNAHNILMDNNNKVWLIDFDRGQLHSKTQSAAKKRLWQQANLTRLKRSLIKETGKYSGFHWQEEDWQQLMLGYNSKHNK